MPRIPLSDETVDPTDAAAGLYLDDTEYDDHYHELDFDADPFELNDPAIEDEQDYGSDA